MTHSDDEKTLWAARYGGVVAILVAVIATGIGFQIGLRTGRQEATPAVRAAVETEIGRLRVLALSYCAEQAMARAHETGEDEIELAKDCVSEISGTAA